MKYLRVILIVLLLGCCTLWVASYWKVAWISSSELLAVGLDNGNFVINRVPFYFGVSGFQSSRFENLDTLWWPGVWFYFHQPVGWLFKISFWLPTLLLALPVAIMESPWARRRRRAKQGLCIRCGYDLSGTEHQACPECGTESKPTPEKLPDGGYP